MFNLSSYFIREHVGLLKLTDTYDILNPETQEQVGIAKESTSGLIILLRFLLHKRYLPVTVDIYEGETTEGASPKFTIKRGFTFIRSRVDVLDSNGNIIGWFKSKMFSFGGAFRVFDASDNEIALVKGDWKGWNFKFLVGDDEIGTITKKWNGLGKEMFTTADNYIIDIHGEVAEENTTLLLAAGLAIDTVFKE